MRFGYFCLINAHVTLSLSVAGLNAWVCSLSCERGMSLTLVQLCVVCLKRYVGSLKCLCVCLRHINGSHEVNL